VLEDNAAGLHEVVFDFTHETCRLDGVIIARRGDWHTNKAPKLPFGSMSWVSVNEVEDIQDVSATFHWRDEHTLEIQWRYHNTPHQDKLLCAFDGDCVTLTCPANRTGGAPEVVLRGKRG
jgi:hypothetical protein